MLGHSGELIDLRAAIAPCLLGYGIIGKRLFEDPNTKRGSFSNLTKDGNPYWPWICNYASDDFQEAVRIGQGFACAYI